MSAPAPATVFALSSGRPPAAIAVIRISGSCAGDALKALIGRVPEPRKAALARVRDPQSGEPIDEALALWFPGPNSETGEDTAEVQLHGGRAVIAAALTALGRIEGLRMAEPGEFTRRAFENGRLDLTAVEGLADLIGAETEAQRRQAYRQLKGLLGGRAEGWRQRLIEALALVEARIDFSDEADVPEDLIAPALKIVEGLQTEIGEVLQGADRSERLRDGLVVAIAGPPNAGKSTLLNAIARREVAIVSEVPGTTRDVIEVHLDLGGNPVTLLDTAGIRDSADPIEQEGVRRARERAAEADLVLWVVDATGPLAEPPVMETPVWVLLNKIDLAGGPGNQLSTAGGRGRTAEAAQTGGTVPNQDVGRSIGVHVAASQRSDDNLPVQSCGDQSAKVSMAEHGADQTESTLSERNELRTSIIDNSVILEISAKSREGVSTMLQRIATYAAQHFGSEPGVVSRERHRKELEVAEAALQRALKISPAEEEIVASELRAAATALGRLTGRIDVEDVLDVIFRDFCIGK